MCKTIVQIKITEDTVYLKCIVICMKIYILIITVVKHNVSKM